MVPTWLFLRQIQARRSRGEPLSSVEAWCSLDYDLYRHGELASERAYAANWRRSREWVRKLIHSFRDERDLPSPAVGRRPSASPTPRPKPNGGLPTAPDSLQTIPDADF